MTKAENKILAFPKLISNPQNKSSPVQRRVLESKRGRGKAHFYRAGIDNK